MSLDKAIKSGKEKRKPLRGSKAVSSMCANLTCPHCAKGVKHKRDKQKPAEQDMEYLEIPRFLRK